MSDKVVDFLLNHVVFGGSSGGGGGSSAAIEEYVLDTATSVSLPNATALQQYAISYRKNLKSIELPNVLSIDQYGIYRTGIEELVLPACNYIATYGIHTNESLKLIDFQNNVIPSGYAVPIRLMNYIAQNANQLETVIFRATVGRVAMQSNTFASTKIGSGSGYFYVPASLLDNYKSVYSSYANQFRALENYTVDGTVTGALDPSKI